MVGLAPDGGNPLVGTLSSLIIFEGFSATIALISGRFAAGAPRKTKAERPATAEGIDDSQVFRHRRHPRPGQWRDHAGTRAEGGAGGRPDLPQGRPPPPRADRQGHPPLGLHDRERADRRLHLGRHGRAAHRPDPDARRRDADALDARRPRRDDLGLAQSVRRQRHQAVRPGRLQALRRVREGDRRPDRFRPRQEARGLAEHRPRAPHRRRAGPLHRIRQAHAAAQHVVRRHARGDRLRQRRGLSRRAGGAVGARRRGVLGRRRAGRLQHQQGLRLDRARGACPPRCARCAPTSASRSTATRTAS